MRGNQSSIVIPEDNDAACQSSPISVFDLSGLPPVYVLAVHLTEVELHQVEDTLVRMGALLTYDIKQAKIVLGNISTERRAKFELKCGEVKTKEFRRRKNHRSPSPIGSTAESSSRKRPNLKNDNQYSVKKKIDSSLGDDQSTANPKIDNENASKLVSKLSEQDSSLTPNVGPCDFAFTKDARSPILESDSSTSVIKVVKLSWLRDSVDAGMAQSLEKYIIYQAYLVCPDEDAGLSGEEETQKQTNPFGLLNQGCNRKKEVAREIMQRAKAEAHAATQPKSSRNRRRDHVKEAVDQDFRGQSFASSKNPVSQNFKRNLSKPPRLLHQTTSEFDENFSSSSPVMQPDWVKEKKIYSCERATPLNPPNEEFIAQLKKIRKARLLIGDEVGVRAYSSSIASIAAYPHLISSTREILALPGCDQKIATIFHEWHTTGHIQAVSDLEADPALKILQLFFEIWGVGAATAREFYYDRHWRDLDDIIEHGWKSLTRVQQIGVKYYEEFQHPMTRSEVEAIADTIRIKAQQLLDSRLECIIVGSYRRGKAESNDADIILSHPSEPKTKNFVSEIVATLEESGHITHTLTLALTNSKRDQQPLPLRSLDRSAGHGFDSLDKALVVWQDPNWPSQVGDLSADPTTKNPNPHRRVDIIISPWRTIGCAVAGWTSGTTFQRDLRRYAKKVKGWKFDSSGVRERETGRWVDLEGWENEETRCTDWREAERRVFEGLGLVFREPWERCTE